MWEVSEQVGNFSREKTTFMVWVKGCYHHGMMIITIITDFYR